ncbi:MAG: CocE/NonD family hydrolase [Panacagrimonas sp.]
MKSVAAVVLCICVGLLSACGGSRSPNAEEGGLPPLPAPDPRAEPGPAAGQTRAGRSYNLFIDAPDGRPISFTVHEPTQMVGGQKYPLLLHGHGFGLFKVNALQRGLEAPVGTPLADIQTVKQFLDAGYGVLSFDQRGFGASGGTVTVMDPDRDGASLIALVDWAQVNLDWLQYRDGNMVLGAYGGSYGGGYQLLLNNIDPRRRLDAIVPSITWNDLSYSLSPGGVLKSGYGVALTAVGEVGSIANLDNEVRRLLINGLANNRFSDEEQARLIYRSNRYFCDGDSQPGRRAASAPRAVDALFFQGMHDVLFNLNEAVANYECQSRAGGDVRLFSYNIGHVLPSGTGLISGGLSAPADFARCGPYIAGEMTLTWFNAKLKRDAAAQSAVNAFPEHCLVLESNGQGVVLDRVPRGGVGYPIAQTLVAQLLPLPVSVPLFTAEIPTVVAGIPEITLTLTHPLALPESPLMLPLGIDLNDAIVFVSLGVSRFGLIPAQLEIVDDQVRPVRGFGTQTLDLNGIGIKLNPGDRLELLLVGQSLPQYPVIVARNPLLPAIQVSGSVRVPVLGDVETVE